MNQVEDVYDAVAKAGHPFKLPSPWQDIPCDGAFVCLPTDMVAFLAKLRKQFDDGLLIKAGVVNANAEGNVVLNRSLLAVNEPIWAIRSKLGHKVNSIIAQMRTLNGRWAIRAALEDHRQGNVIPDAADHIAVLYSMQNLAIARSVGLVAIPGSDWRKWSKSQLDFMCRKLCITSRTPPAPIHGVQLLEPAWRGPLSLVLANWSMGAMDRADIAAAKASWAHLGLLHQHLDRSLERVYLWKPSEKNLTRLRYQLRYEDIPQVCAGLLQDMQLDATAIDAGLHFDQSSTQSISEATRAWQRAERDTTNPVGRQRAFDQLCELQDKLRFEPLIREALRATNPLERNAEIALAETSRLLHPQMLLLSEKARRSISENGVRGGIGIAKEELDQVLALNNQVLALTEGVHACRKGQPSKIVKAPTPAAVRSKPLDSLRKKSPR